MFERIKKYAHQRTTDARIKVKLEIHLTEHSIPSAALKSKSEFTVDGLELLHSALEEVEKRRRERIRADLAKPPTRPLVAGRQQIQIHRPNHRAKADEPYRVDDLRSILEDSARKPHLKDYIGHEGATR